MKNINLYALANELNLGDPKSGTIRVPFGRWDFGAKKMDDGRTVFFVQELTKDGAERMAAKINAGVADGEKGVPVYWGHPDVPELAHKYPDKRAKGWIKSATVEGDALILHVEWLEENATDGFGWFSPYWGGPATDLGQGRYLKHLDSLTSVALINIPNIQEFRLANELQGGLNDNERTFAMPQHLIDLAKRFDERVLLPNEANYDESKHPRDENSQWTSGGGGSSKPKGLEFKNTDGERQSVEHVYKNSLIDGHTIMKNKKSRAEKANAINQLIDSTRKNRKEKYEDLFGPESKGAAQQRQRSGRASMKALHAAAISAGLSYNRATHQYE